METVLLNLCRGTRRWQTSRVKGTDRRRRESGSIEQDADIVMFLHREALYNDQESVNDAKCIVAKNRHGETGSIDLYWDGQYTRFSSIAYGREPD